MTVCGNNETFDLRADDETAPDAITAGQNAIFDALGCLGQVNTSFAYWHGGMGQTASAGNCFVAIEFAKCRGTEEYETWEWAHPDTVPADVVKRVKDAADAAYNAIRAALAKAE